MENLLSASSILLAIITALYAVFYPFLIEVIEIKSSNHSADNKLKLKLAKDTFNSKLLPLLIGSIVITFLFIPEFFNAIKTSYKALDGNNEVKYDTLIASFLVVCIFMIFLSCAIINLAFKLKSKIKELATSKPKQKE